MAHSDHVEYCPHCGHALGFGEGYHPECYPETDKPHKDSDEKLPEIPGFTPEEIKEHIDDPSYWGIFGA